MEELNNRLQNAAIAQVAEDFMDTTTNLKQLEKAARAPPGKIYLHLKLDFFTSWWNLVSGCILCNFYIWSDYLADMPGREAEFENKAGEFENQANQIAETAIRLANAGGNTNKRLLGQIRQNADEVSRNDKILLRLFPCYIDNIIF